MKIKNLILKEEAERWMAKSPTFDKALKKFSMFISLGDVISEIYQFKEQELRDFIAGWIPLFLCFAINNEDKKAYLEKESTKLLQPVMDKIKEYCKSDTYRSSLINQQITGETVLEIDGVKEVIGEKAILQHIKRVNTNPLTVKDIENIERSYIAYKRDLYRDPSPLINGNYLSNIPSDDDETTSEEFTALRIKKKYDPNLVYTQFKKILKCDINTFNDWFVAGKVSDSKMSWNYDNQNKTQLRSFLLVLCGGWSPKHTNMAFKIQVSSNIRQNNLNKILSDKIDKCKF